jgi:hypothetical protein
MWLVAALTLISGIVVAVRMRERSSLDEQAGTAGTIAGTTDGSALSRRVNSIP